MGNKKRATLIDRLERLPRVRLGQLPTPLERLDRLSNETGGAEIWVKRDDCTGLAFGGNKVRQLEYYLGQARKAEADSVLITGAVQSNFVRSCAAAAAKMGLECHIQLEERVPRDDEFYRQSGNVLLDRLLGAQIYSYANGEDEAGADRRLGEIASDLRAAGKRPYIVPLSPGHPPFGALGYVAAAAELAAQLADQGLAPQEIIVASGSGATHAGLLFGIRALDLDIVVTGICVRRDATAQRQRIESRCQEIADLLQMDNPVRNHDLLLDDSYLAPGYGKLNAASKAALLATARSEGLLLDPVYTAKPMAACLDRAAAAQAGCKIIFIHTGGTPALFGYHADLQTLF
ncbi:D-cysteine desulfhydrase family protein [Limibacillus halophilus]|uniref:D-cysteine desulfhydrase/L-cysteate sulfo-lyase n=1 Tax=Limibacillus halophilus TaxID=1579333 RepID=A0A839SRV6_9PROT|nr:D-cysteine desulfhydrase family protein [Limibacillus halophilus]MBB3065212.1 D-cysteine desulfhydrase/L-cysteate sulfo-lyase [Limibacillus halophilus]